MTERVLLELFRHDVTVKDSIDCLGDDVGHLSSLRGQVLSTEPDPTLDALAMEAATLLGTPIALISLVLRRTQHFRAAYGLPPELRLTRSTDRCVSFCQLVVRDKTPLIVRHASQDPRVPQDLVKRFGIKAYVGAPVCVGDTVVGSICGLDLVPREFSPELVDSLVELARRASDRLTVLANHVPAQTRRVGRAAEPAFAEIRNALVGISAGAQGVDLARLDLEGIGQLTSADLTSDERERVAGALRQAPQVLDDLRMIGDELKNSFERIFDAVRGLEALVSAREKAELAACLLAADRLAEHYTKLVGGTKWDHVDPTVCVRAAPAVVVAIASSALSELSLRDQKTSGGVQISIEHQGDIVTLSFALAGMEHGHFDYQAAASRLEVLTDAEPGISIRSDDRSLRITLAVHERSDAPVGS